MKTTKRHKIAALVLVLLLALTVPLILYSCEWLGLDWESDEVYSDTLKISIYTHMMDPDVLDEFQREHKVYLDIYYHDRVDDEFFVANSDFDMILVDQFVIEEYSQYLHPINQSNISNRRYLDHRVTTMPHDFGLTYSFPVFWGSFGFAYNDNHYSGLPLSWEYLFKPDILHRGYISILNDERYMLGTALIYLGHSPNSTDSVKIAEAAELINNAKFYYRSISTKEEMIDMFHNGYISAFPSWSGAAVSLKKTNPNIRFVLPGEGALFFLSSFVILNTSEKNEIAEKFINFNVEPTRIARHTNYGGYANTIPESSRYVERRIIMGPSYISPFVTHASYSLDALEPEVMQLYHDIWNSLNPNEFEGFSPPPIYDFR